MKVMTSSGGYMVRLQRGEEIHESLTGFAREYGIRGASISGIGAVENAEAGFYNWGKKGYDRFHIPEVTELLSLTGNLALNQGEPFLHAHVVLMHSDLRITGGHLFQARIAVTGEFAVTLADLSLDRLFDEEVRLGLLEQGS